MLYSILLVLARTPAVQELTPFLDFFHIALVVHVDLSILIWLLSMSGVFWSLSSGRDMPAWDRVSFWLAAGGTLIVVLSPFMGASRTIDEQLCAGPAASGFLYRAGPFYRWHLQPPVTLIGQPPQGITTSMEQARYVLE